MEWLTSSIRLTVASLSSKSAHKQPSCREHALTAEFTVDCLQAQLLPVRPERARALLPGTRVPVVMLDSSLSVLAEVKVTS